MILFFKFNNCKKEKKFMKKKRASQQTEARFSSVPGRPM